MRRQIIAERARIPYLLERLWMVILNARFQILSSLTINAKYRAAEQDQRQTGRGEYSHFISLQCVTTSSSSAAYLSSLSSLSLYLPYFFFILCFCLLFATSHFFRLMWYFKVAFFLFSFTKTSVFPLFSLFIFPVFFRKCSNPNTLCGVACDGLEDCLGQQGSRDRQSPSVSDAETQLSVSSQILHNVQLESWNSPSN